MTTHIDDWLDIPAIKGPEAYAKFVLMYMRMPAWCQCSFAPWMAEHRLFCTFGGERYRVTGASRMGDIWLARDPKRGHGYDARVAVDDCSDWGEEP